MLKLVSQFDNERMRTSIATPTCGPCCCCCCCCVVTALSTSILAGRSYARILEKKERPEIMKIKNEKEREKKLKDLKWRTIKFGLKGSLRFPIYLLLIILFVSIGALELGWLMLIFSPFFLGIDAYLTYRACSKSNLNTGKIKYAIFTAPVFFIIEFFMWLYYPLLIIIIIAHIMYHLSLFKSNEL